MSKLKEDSNKQVRQRLGDKEETGVDPELEAEIDKIPVDKKFNKLGTILKRIKPNVQTKGNNLPKKG